jgi:hypothetical protein
MTWNRSQLEAILTPPVSPERQLVAADLALEHGEEMASLALRIAARHPGQFAHVSWPDSFLDGDTTTLIWVNTEALVCASWRHLSHSAYFSSLSGQWLDGRGSTHLSWLTDDLKAGVLQHLRQFHRASGA